MKSKHASVKSRKIKRKKEGGEWVGSMATVGEGGKFQQAPESACNISKL